MEFRRLNVKDLDSVFSNRLRALAGDPDSFLTTLEEEKAHGAGRFRDLLAQTGDERLIFGALEDGKVVGTLGIYIEDKFKLRHKAIVWGVHVDQEYRGRGLAARLLDMAIEYARERLKAKVIYLTVAPHNTGAVKLYESRGFKTWGIEPRAVFDGDKVTDEVHMSLVL